MVGSIQASTCMDGCIVLFLIDKIGDENSRAYKQAVSAPSEYDFGREFELCFQ